MFLAANLNNGVGFLCSPTSSFSVTTLTFLGGLAFGGGAFWFTEPNNNVLSNQFADSLGFTPQFSVGATPTGVAFDGTNMWVANLNSDTVSKVSVSTGAVVGTYQLPAGSKPYGVAFDGASIWVTNSGNNTVSRF